MTFAADLDDHTLAATLAHRAGDLLCQLRRRADEMSVAPKRQRIEGWWRMPAGTASIRMA